LPCANYISDTTHFPDAPILRRVFNGFAQAALDIPCSLLDIQFKNS